MADQNLTQLTPITPAADDLLYIVDDPEGTPADGSTTVADLLATQHDHTVSDITDFPSIPNDIDDIAPSQTGNSGKVLTTDGTNATWQTPSGGASDLDDLSDVVISSPSNGQVLKFNGTNWVNDADATGGGGGGLDNVVEDTTPQLGGDLDANGHDILLDDTNVVKFGAIDVKSQTADFGDTLVLDNAGSGMDVAGTSSISFSGNAGTDGSGNWMPYVSMNATGVLDMVNTAQGSAGSRYAKIEMTDGLRLVTDGNTAATEAAILKADNVTGGNKTFQLPNASGTIELEGHTHTASEITDFDTEVENNTKVAGIETGADVTDATNVAAAGAVMESDTSTASMAFVVDEDDMSSNSATKVPTQQSVKAYVDTEIAGVGGGGSSTPQGFLSLTYESADAGHSTGIISGAAATYGNGAGYLRLKTNTTSGATAYVAWSNNATHKGDPAAIKNPKGTAMFAYGPSVAANFYYRFFTSAGNYTTNTAHQMGVKGITSSSTTTWSSTTGDGTTETATALSGPGTAGQQRNVSAVLTEGVNCKFYYEGVLKNTHTTNLPGTGSNNWRQYWAAARIDNASTSNDSVVDISHFSMSWDLY